jgi:hypothetical protein
MALTRLVMSLTGLYPAAVFFFCCASAVAAMDCPQASKDVAKDIAVSTEASVEGLRGLASGSLKNKTETTTKNLFEKYPNADRVAVATTMMSIYCQQIDRSTTLSDAEKLDRLMTVNQVIIPLMTAPH